MLQRERPNENHIFDADVASGKSSVVVPILQLIAKWRASGHSQLVYSHKYSPSEIFERMKQVDNFHVLPNGKLGTTLSGKPCEIGELCFLYSKEHFFNAVLVCCGSDDLFDIDSDDGAALFCETADLLSAISEMNADGIASARVAGGQTEFGEPFLSFDMPVAQEVYDSQFVGADFRDPDGLTETAQEWFSPSLNSMSEPAQKRGGCYVATAVYGSYDCPEVWTLRRYRDNDLAKTWYGRLFIKVYYAVSPKLVSRFGKAPWFQKYWKRKLDTLVTSLRKNGYESTPYSDKPW